MTLGSDTPSRDSPRSETILMVEDDSALRGSIAEALQRIGYSVLEADRAEDGLETYARERPDLVLLDVDLPDKSGLDILDDLHADGAVVVFLTGSADVATAVQAMQRGAESYLTKPIEFAQLAATIARGVEKSRLRREVRRLRGRATGSLVGALGISRAMQALEHEIAIVAESPRTTVLLTGESGTGKGRVAEMIHARSPRASGPFVGINCGGLSVTLLDDDLFGHERGAFTDAKTAKAGLLEVADGGTLFLDEIGDMPLDVQPKLLTFLDSRRFRRLGGTREIAADLRIVAATNRDLDQAVAEKVFRQDLYYRIAVSVIRLPTLQERTRDDRLHLLQRVLAELSDEVPGAPTEVTGATLDRLLEYPWPGNIREMRNVLERGMIMARGESAIAPYHLPVEVREARSIERRAKPRRLIDGEREQIVRMLQYHRGNRTRAARDLGVSRVTLLKKIRKFGLE